MKSPSLNADIVFASAPPTADTEFTVAHSLGRIPVVAFVVQRDKAGRVYKGTTAWDASNIYLKSSVVTHGLKLLIA